MVRPRVRVKDIGVQHNTRDVMMLGGPRMMVKAGPSTITMTIEFEASDQKTMDKMAKLMGEHQNGGPDIMMELSLIRADGPRTMPDIEPEPRTEFDLDIAKEAAREKLKALMAAKKKAVPKPPEPSADIPTTPPPEGTW